MHTKLRAATICTIVLLGVGFTTQAPADNLTQAVQKDLVILGYDPGNIDGESTTATTIAIAKFEADHDMEMTGEVTPQLAGQLSAMVAEKNGTATAMATKGAAESSLAQDPAALEAAQQACLQEKIEEARQKEKKRRGFGSLMSAVGRTAGQLGNESVSRTADGAVAANQTAADLSSAANDLGVTDDEIAACENPT